jgi:putative ABC transport system permease protein
MFLAVKEVWRNRGRFLLIAAVVGLITTLVLFIAGLTEGLGKGNREYIEKLNAELVVYQANVDLSIPASRIGQDRLDAIREVDGVLEAGPISSAAVSLVFDTREPLRVSAIGVEPGRPGEPPVVEGRGLGDTSDAEALIDSNVASRAGVRLGDTIRVRSIVGDDETFYALEVVGITTSQQYFIQPSIIVAQPVFETIQPRPAVVPRVERIFNVAAVRLERPDARAAERIVAEVDGVEAVDIPTAYTATPGYSAQQSTLDTQRGFTLVIAVLVIGGFFQIQTLQKVGQVGVLKAIGAPNGTIIAASVIQILVVNAFGVVLGTVGTLLLSLALPGAIPIVFSRGVVVGALAALLLIGPAGGVVSIRTLLRAEPLKALGLAS